MPVESLWYNRLELGSLIREEKGFHDMSKRLFTTIMAGALACSVILPGCAQQDATVDATGNETIADAVSEEAGTATDAAKETSEQAQAKGDDTEGTTKKTKDYLVLVNNDNELPDDWEATVDLIEVPNPMGEKGSGPIPVERKAYDAFVALQKDLKENDGVDIELDSAYRSVEKQQQVWDEFLADKGEEYTKSHVAVPGYSEHHTGLAIDVYLVIDGEDVFENDEMMKHPEIWEKVHAKLADYGFILRYLDGKKDITGYDYEPWHLRYIDSEELAKEITDSGLTFEEWVAQQDGKASEK